MTGCMAQLEQLLGRFASEFIEDGRVNEQAKKYIHRLSRTTELTRITALRLTLTMTGVAS